MDRVESLINKLESSGIEKVRENLRHERYSSWKIPYVEDWIAKKEAPTVMYHEVHAPTGKTFKAYECSELERNGWVDTPAKFGTEFRRKTEKTKIFICYRREDSKWPAQWIYNDLSDHFGSESVVFDVDTIPLGIDFREYLNKQVSKCDILLAVIGDQWEKILKQRHNEPNDFVRIEIQAALERNIPVVPVLVGKAPVPNEKNLPPELMGLSYKQAAEVHAGPNLQTHLKRLITGLDLLIAEHTAEKERKQKEEQKRGAIAKEFKNSIGMEFVLIPTGSFMMGSKLDAEELVQKYGRLLASYEYVHPQHYVAITQSFYLQSTAVTQDQWEKVMEDNPSHFKDCGVDCPVEDVSWDDAQDFIKKLNEREGDDNYRLPTEAEWEYACRGGTTTEFSFGDDASGLSDYGWYSYNSEERTYPVGKKRPNPWNVYDMYGNIWEWVEDDWHETYAGAPVNGSAWVDKKRCYHRVIRGGSWRDSGQFCRSASRKFIGHDGRTNDVGFRLARSIALGS